MKRIVVLNPKGGSGKTTIATNLAGYYASQANPTVLIDQDRQGSSQNWVAKRPPSAARIHLIAPFDTRPNRTTRSFRLRLPERTSHVIVDTPAAVSSIDIKDLTRDADKILVPVLPSDIDIHACSLCIRDLLLVAKVRRDEDRIGVIANRVRSNTLTYQSLMRFLGTLGIPIVATIHDSQSYLRAAEMGVGVHEMRTYLAHEDRRQWEPLIEWLDRPRVRALSRPSRQTA
jgi:chromosome partitioning protein